MKEGCQHKYVSMKFDHSFQPRPITRGPASSHFFWLSLFALPMTSLGAEDDSIVELSFSTRFSIFYIDTMMR